tara:strand:+ start:555 stop:884 length:330 start_codon:yes stop_codon:yes gene_type:complete
MEEFVLSDLVDVQGIESIALLDSEGLVKMAFPENTENRKKLTQLADMLDNSSRNKTMTILTDSNLLIIQSLQASHTMALLCEKSCNIGAIRHHLDNAVQRLNAYFNSSE